MKYTILISLFAMVSVCCKAQTCILTLSGKIQDADTKKSLAGATVVVKETGKSVTANKQGVFEVSSICPGIYTLIITFVGYDSLLTNLKIDSSVQQVFQLPHTRKELSEVQVITERKQDIATNGKSEITAAQLFQTRGQTLGESLKGLPGLNSIQTGPSISKPVIHGLHSNRLLILNNGVRQEGQQWGSEHAPEIDPFIANKITVIKGAASVRYGSDAIVGVILVEPKSLEPAKSFGGELDAAGGTNGRSGALSGLLEGKSSDKLPGFNWRVQGTLKRAGNFKTADYYLKNSGLAESDFSLATNYKNKKENFGADIYYSHFHNKVGIFEGSHVGNITDLEAAFARPKPLTASYFSYDINRTYQNINHDLLKISSFYKFKNAGRLEAVYSSQKNKRDEYDIDLPYSTDPNILKLPQISFQIKTQALDLIYHQPSKDNLSGSFGIIGNTQGNVFKGIRYLVPNFRNYNSGIFGIERYSKNKLTLEAGLRYDYRWLRVYKLDNNTLQTYFNTHTYSNVTATVGSSYRFSDQFSMSANIGSAWRAPSVNELYIDGIHLSAASYEKGDSSLQSERSYNFTVSGKYERDKFFAEVVLYNNIINNFIYAKPTLQPITLINGTFPFFQYTQVNANLKGFDLELQYKPLTALSIDSKTSIVRGWNKSIHDYLLFMPADRYVNSIKYEFDHVRSLSNFYISIENVAVLRQTRVPPNSDYVPPPKGYMLFNASAGFEIPLSGRTLSIDLAAYNVNNVAYRDYLNRFRYYADDLGMNLVLRTKFIF